MPAAQRWPAMCTRGRTIPTAGLPPLLALLEMRLPPPLGLISARSLFQVVLASSDCWVFDSRNWLLPCVVHCPVNYSSQLAALANTPWM